MRRPLPLALTSLLAAAAPAALAAPPDPLACVQRTVEVDPPPAGADALRVWSEAVVLRCGLPCPHDAAAPRPGSDALVRALREAGMPVPDRARAVPDRGAPPVVARDGAGRAVIVGGDLAGADLSGQDLAGAVVACVDLSGADLSGADLRGARMALVNLRGADVRGVLLAGARLAEVRR